MSDAKKLDANDLLKRWKAEGTATEAQRATIQGMVATAQPLIERMAEAAGEMRAGLEEDETWSQDYEDAVGAVVALALTLDESTLGRYKNKLARKMKMLTRDFNNALAGKKKDGKKKKEDEIPEIPTFGGWFENNGEFVFVDYWLDYDRKQGNLVWRDPKGNITSGRELLIKNGHEYKLVPIDPDDEPLIIPALGQESASVIMPPGCHEKPVTLNEVLGEVVNFIKHQYLFDDEKTPFIIAITIISSWVYENFRTLSYLRAIGDKGSGKSELMRRAGHLCYRLTKVGGGDTESVFFRITDLFRGTLFIEEADMEQSGASSNIVKFYNFGAMDGNYVNRSEEWLNPRTGTKTFRTRGFSCFCPKLFAMRGEFQDDAVGSRSLDIRLIGKSTKELIDAGIELEMGSRYWAGWRKLVPKLMRLRMQERTREKIDMDMSLADVLVSARFNQVTMPIKILAARAGDKNLLMNIQNILRAKHAEETAEKSMLTEARVVEALWKMYTYSDLRARLVIREDGEILVKIGDVAAITNNIIEEMKEEGQDLRTAKPEGETAKKKNYEVGPQKVGHIMRDVIQLRRLEQRSNKGFFCIWDDVKMEIAGRKFGVLPEVEKIQAAREALAGMRAKVDLTRKPLQMTIEEHVSVDGPPEPDIPEDWQEGLVEPEPEFE